MVDGRGFYSSYYSPYRRLGDRRSLPALLFAGDTLIPGLGNGGRLRVGSVSLSSPGPGRIHYAAGLCNHICRVGDSPEHPGDAGWFLNDVALSDPYYAADLCLRSLLRRVHGQRDVPAPGAGTQTQDFQCYLSSPPVTFYRK